MALHLTRRTRGLPLWFSLATHGTDRYRDAVELSLTAARTVADWIRGQSFVQLVREPELSVLLFERPGWSPDEYTAWSKRAAAEGTMLCVPTTWNGQTVLRLAFVNPATDPARVIEILQTLA
jgi:glutamate/tyrosine decarboxylase-like PLP-dependent enzyme